jgi:molybdopterin-containing oxidoreductase family iron-sulfur binding subunit
MAGAVVVAPGVVLHAVAEAEPRSEAVSSKVRWGMLIDTTKCADGCRACVDACDQENGLNLQAKPEGEDARKWDQQRSVWIRKVKVRDNLTGRVTGLPVMCQHCELPPCVDVCPTGASFKRADGIVMVDRHICIGCRYCMMACPYKARSLVHEPLNDTQKPDVPRGIGCVEACTLCVQKVDRGDGNTACAEACTKAGHNAILFGDMNDPESEISKRLRELPTKQVRADLNLNLGIRYHGI